MKKEWLSLLRDPDTGSELHFGRITREARDRVLDGELISPAGRCYSIRNGVPVFVGEGAQSVRSVSSFAYEWEAFGFLFAREGWFKDIVEPLVGSIDFFRGKTVVDAGAGSGSQSRWMAEAGARLVISLELSEGIFSVHRQTIAGLEDVVFPVQCDIARPPLATSPDVLYCMNVLQHTAKPGETFAQLSKLVGEATVFLFNIYTERSSMKSAAVRAVRRCIRPLPFALWKWMAFAVALVGYPLAKVPVLKSAVRSVVPLSHSFRETWLDVYDAFGGHWYQKTMTLEDQLSMIASAGLQVKVRAPFGFRLERMPDSRRERTGIT